MDSVGEWQACLPEPIAGGSEPSEGSEVGGTLPGMRYLHTMLRVRDLDAALDFFVKQLGLRELRRKDSEKGRFTLVFLGTGAEDDPARDRADLQLGSEGAVPDRAASSATSPIEVDDIYATCERLRERRAILRPPRDGHMAFIKSPDGQSVELLQRGDALPRARALGLDAQPGRMVNQP